MKAFALAAALALLGAAPAPISVLYAGSLVTPMEGPIKTALLARGIAFAGEPGGSKKLANFIRDGVRTPDVFIFVDPSLLKRLAGHVKRATTFASTSLGIGWSGASRFADALKHTDPLRIRYILALPGFRLGRTDPLVDPKGAYAVQALHAIGGAELMSARGNAAAVFPEEDLLARVETGEIDAGVFYRTEAIARGLHFVAFPGKATMSDRILYTLAVMRDAPHPAQVAPFERFILSGPGRAILTRAGLHYR